MPQRMTPLAASLKQNPGAIRKPQEEEVPYIKKPPEVVNRTLELEQPVSELLDDYSRFVECSPDHVTNFVLKKLLWRDPEYRKWRSEKKATPAKATIDPTAMRIVHRRCHLRGHRQRQNRKTSCCMYPFADQILAYKASEEDRRIGGLVLEVKGDFCNKIKEILARHGREEDYIEIGLGSQYRYNPLHNDLDAYALAYSIASLLNNLFGKGKEPFWQQA